MYQPLHCREKAQDYSKPLQTWQRVCWGLFFTGILHFVYICLLFILRNLKTCVCPVEHFPSAVLCVTLQIKLKLKLKYENYWHDNMRQHESKQRIRAVILIHTWSHQHSEKLGNWCSRLYSRNSNMTLIIIHIHQSRIISVWGKHSRRGGGGGLSKRVTVGGGQQDGTVRDLHCSLLQIQHSRLVLHTIHPNIHLPNV